MTEEKMKTSIGIKDPAHTPFPHRGTHVTSLQLMRVLLWLEVMREKK